MSKQLTLVGMQNDLRRLLGDAEWNQGKVAARIGIGQSGVSDFITAAPGDIRTLGGEDGDSLLRLNKLLQDEAAAINPPVPYDPSGNDPLQDIAHGLRAIDQGVSELRHLYNDGPVGFCVMDTDLRFTNINEWLAKINGVSEADHIGCTLREIVPEIADSMEEVYEWVIESGKPAINVVTKGATQARDGEQRIFQAGYYPVSDDRGRVIKLRTIVWDITEQATPPDPPSDPPNKTGDPLK